jgi:hypothetical protein
MAEDEAFRRFVNLGITAGAGPLKCQHGEEGECEVCDALYPERCVCGCHLPGVEVVEGCCSCRPLEVDFLEGREVFVRLSGTDRVLFDG